MRDHSQKAVDSPIFSEQFSLLIRKGINSLFD